MSYGSSGTEHSPWWMSCTCSISCSSEKTSEHPVPLRKWGEKHQCHLLSFFSELQTIASHQPQWSPHWRGVFLPILFISKHQVSNCRPSFLTCLAKSTIHLSDVVSEVVETTIICLVSKTDPGRNKWQDGVFCKKAALICWPLDVELSADIRLSVKRFWEIENEYIMV